MSQRVKRGLGLIVVAVTAVVASAIVGSTDAGHKTTVGEVFIVAAGWVAFLAGLAGLTLIAVGLLRD